MDPNNTTHRRNHTTQSIPLQDLSRPPEEGHHNESTPHRRTLSDRGRASFARGGGNRRSGRYAAVADTSSGSQAQPHPQIPSIRTVDPSGDGTWLDDNEAHEGTPMVDAGQFQQALGFAGLSFEGDQQQASLASHQLPHNATGLGNLLGHYDDDYSSLADVSVDEGHDDSTADETDRTRLTDARHIQGMDGAVNNTTPSSGRRRERLSPQTLRFATPERSTSRAYLGDELAAAESGMHDPSPTRGRSSSIARSLSPSTPLYRASTMVRKMSQRVVNLSNEPEVVEQEIRRRGSGQRRREDTDGERHSHDDNASQISSEKMPSQDLDPPVPIPPANYNWVQHANPLRGKSLGIFPPESKIRTKLCDFMVHPLTEPSILALIILQTILLAVDAAPNKPNSSEEQITVQTWNHSWIDYTILVLFVIYTFEIAIRTIVSGFVVNPVEYSTINRQVGLKQAIAAKTHTFFALHQDEHTVKQTPVSADLTQPSAFRSLTWTPAGPAFAHDDRYAARARLAHRAFLRHSFNRLDFLAVTSYWIGFMLAVTGAEASAHVHAFRMLGCLRILRLLSLTSGTSIILRSLKKAAPLLLNVALLIGFFWLLFAIVGVQSFKSSLRRNCVWVDPTGEEANYTTNSFGGMQFCGGSVDSNRTRHPWQYVDGSSSGNTKGYLCPPNSYCVSDLNPYNGTVSFDNIFQSAELVFVILTSNTFTDIMYYITDSDYLIGAIFFAIGIVVLTFWLMNLLIAVITSSFQVIREESQASAFAPEENLEPMPIEEPSSPRKASAKTLYERSFWFWIAVVTYGLICQCLRSADMSPRRGRFIDASETVVTLLLFVEIVIRFSVDWRKFFRHRHNYLDLGLAVMTVIMQIPPIHRSGQAYAWLTIFQVLRIYRVVLAIPWTRDLILLVLGRTAGFLNLILFVFLLTFLVAILASQLFRGEVPQLDPNGNTIHVKFDTIWNCFLGMYQVLSSENWTILLYSVTAYDVEWNTAWIGAIFLILWFILGFSIVLSMFIAVIQENFDVSEDEKRLQQVKAFLQQKELGGSSHGTLSLSSMFKLRAMLGQRQDPLDYGPAMTEMLLKDAVVKDFLDDNMQADGTTDSKNQGNGSANGVTHARHVSMTRPVSMNIREVLAGSWWQRLKHRVWHEGEPNPFYTRFKFSRAYEDLDPRSMAREVVSAAERRKVAQREYLIKHPTYNVSVFVFKPSNSIRRVCQKLVGPGRGRDRVEGTSPSPIAWYAFSAFLYATIVAMVLLACVTTPLYQKRYWSDHDFSVHNWFVFTDLAFAAIFTVEAAIRIIADGFFWTPNAYFRSTWGCIDGVVLVTLWINVLTSLYNEGAVARAVGAFKALRALRLLNVSDSARDTFHSVIVRGGWKVLSAAFVSLSLLIPFAIYGLNLFNGQMRSCNDPDASIQQLSNCVNEYMASPSNWEILAPRQVSNSWYSFDNFGDSLFILFQIVSQEGWVDVMWRAVSITGKNMQLQDFNRPGNAVFFVVFNLLGAVFVLTLFVSVFMRNYTEQTGVAFLTTDQRSWLELRKLLRQISPSKRPPAIDKISNWKQWCYRRAVRKTGRWQRIVTMVLLFHLVLLCSESYPEPFWWARTRDYMFLLLTLFYVANIIIRIVGLTWTRFRRSSWDLYSLFAISGTFVTTVILVSNFQQRVYIQLHSLFLVSVVLLLIPRNNQLDQLFKTAAASLTAIGNLMATWFVLFLVFAIAFTQTFGLTRFSKNETDNINFRDVPKALILLFRCSTGEGWDQIMEDYAGVVPPFCTIGDNFLSGDCGSAAWARALFISWNILSMYIFVNMFVSLIYESFSYVYQRSSGLSVISRKEIRRFKQAWAEFDPDGNGYISKEAFPRFLGELSGVFEMRIYPENFTVGYLKSTCGIYPDYSVLPLGDDSQRKAKDLDLDLLKERLQRLPIQEVRARRTRMNVFYEEVMVSADPDRGIGFNSLLMVLAHYKVINDNKSLRLEEFLRRRARLQRVEEAVRRSIVVGFFDTLYWRRRFKQHMAKKRAARIAELPILQVPEIVVEDEDGPITGDAQQDFNFPERGASLKKPALSVQIPGAKPAPEVTISDFGAAQTLGSYGQASGFDARPRSSGLRNRADSIQLSPGGTGHGNSGPPTAASAPTWDSVSPTTVRHSLHPAPLFSHHRDRAGSDVSISGSQSSMNQALGLGLGRMASHGRALSVEDILDRSSEDGSAGGRSRAGSNVSARDVLDVLDNSAWGASIKRSFTVKGGGGTRKESRGSGGGGDGGQGSSGMH